MAPPRESVQASVLSGIDANVRRRILGAGERRTVRRREVIFTEGTPAAHLHIVQSGAVELFGSIGDKKSAFALALPGDCFILAAVVRSAAALMSARAIEASEILAIPADLFRQAMRCDSALSINVSMELGGEFRSMVKHLRDHKLRTSQQRVAAYLLRLTRSCPDARSIELPVNKRMLSSLLGIKPESLSRVISALRAYGIRVERQNVHVDDIAVLEKLANSDWAIDDPIG